LKRALPPHSRIELTLSLDRGGQLNAQARVVETGQVFDDVIRLQQAVLSLAELPARIEQLSDRLNGLRQQAFTLQAADVVRTLTLCDSRLAQMRGLLEPARLGDADALAKASRLGADLDAELSEAEQTLTWPRLEEEIEDEIQSAVSWVGGLGNAAEQRTLETLLGQIDRARARRDAKELRGKLVVLRKLRSHAFLRHADAWRWEFDHAVSRLSTMSDPARAQALIDDGHKKLSAGAQPRELEPIVRQLWTLMPPDERERRASFDSGVV
jgi:hypothetical protein